MKRISLELPITTKESHNKKWDVQTSRILIEFEKTSTILDDLSKLIFEARLMNKILFAQTINLFESFKKTESLLEKKSIKYWIDEDLKNKTKEKTEFILLCNHIDTVKYVISNLTSEAIVFYSLPLVDNKPFKGNELLKAGSKGYFEKHFLDILPDCKCKYFIFYASTHDSLEIIGEKTSLLDYFNKII